MRLLNRYLLRQLAAPFIFALAAQTMGFVARLTIVVAFPVAWMLAALRPKGPYPVLVLQGEQGSSKSTTERLLRASVDPNTATTDCQPSASSSPVTRLGALP